MHYTDPVERSAEYLRLAIPYMSRQDAALHPVSYAVWYEYVSGRNRALNETIDRLLKSGQKLDEQSTHALYGEFVADPDERKVGEVSGELQRVIGELAQSTTESSKRTGDYGNALQAWEQRARSAATLSALGGDLEEILRNTNDVKSSIDRLQVALDASRSEVEQLRGELSRLRREALTDGLSGLLNRRGFDQTLQSLVTHHNESNAPLSMLMVDIDHFKKVNDSYGHLFGDRVIRHVAQVIRACIKGSDLAGRYGGEEFAILLPNTPVAGAGAVAEHIRAAVQKSKIRRPDRDEIVGNITISIGVATCTGKFVETDLLVGADTALYAAKKLGRNRVYTAPSTPG